MKQLFLLPLFLVSALGALAQENYPTVITAEEAYARHEYQRAAKLYEKTLKFHHVPANAEERLADCYRQQNEFAKAAKVYDRITSKHTGNGQDWVYYGDVLKSLGHYPEAKAAYRQAPDSLQGQVAVKIAGCDSALIWMAAPVPYRVTNLEAANTTHSDWGAQWYGDHSIVFTSDSLRSRALGRGKKIDREVYRRTGHPFQKIYVLDSTVKGLGKVKGFSEEMNANTFHDGPVSFSTKGDTAYYTVTNPEAMTDPGDVVKYKEGKKTITWTLRRLEIFWTVKDSTGNWGPAHSLSVNNASSYSVGHAAVSRDGKTLYFTSDMPGGEGKTDIWFVARQDDGSWSAPVNCGSVLNTFDEDAFPTIGVDGRLYFASKGHPGMGGFDIFSATGQRTEWQSIRNLGYPINSPSDDFYFTTRDSLSGFLSSDRAGGRGGDDIYEYVYAPGKQGAPLTYSVPAPHNPILRTQLVDSVTGQPLDGASVVISQPSKDRRYTTITPATGTVSQPVDSGSQYTDSVFKSGYTGRTVTISTTGVHQDTLNVRLCLQKNPQIGEIFVLRNLFYDFDKSNIRPDAAKILDGLVGYLKQFPSVTIDLSSHTDSRGSDAYNLALSEKRAESARKYLMDHGIASQRVTVHGYGETRLVNDCGNGVPCSEAKHQANRRTEVRVLHP
jgi:outer membrane protein OmpA-like peptidoglycan-associated protein